MRGAAAGLAAGGGGGLAEMAGSVVLGRAGCGASSPKRSMLGAGAGAGAGGLLTAAGGARLDVPFLCESDLSILAFSCTTFSGCGDWTISFRFFGVHGSEPCTYNIIISLSAQRGRIRHGPIHDPSLRVILCPDKVLYLAAL